MALLAYKKEQKENFNFRHCWTELRNSLKWNREGALKVRRRNITQQSLINEHFNLDDNDDCPQPADMPLEQSERKKHSKRRAGKDNDAVVISPYPEPSPISAVSMSAFVCSSGCVFFYPTLLCLITSLFFNISRFKLFKLRGCCKIKAIRFKIYTCFTFIPFSDNKVDI